MVVVDGFCFVCNQKAKFVCTLCGKLVCPIHFNSELGVCKDCSNGPRIKTSEIK